MSQFIQILVIEVQLQAIGYLINIILFRLHLLFLFVA